MVKSAEAVRLSVVVSVVFAARSMTCMTGRQRQAECSAVQHLWRVVKPFTLACVLIVFSGRTCRCSYRP